MWISLLKILALGVLLFCAVGAQEIRPMVGQLVRHTVSTGEDMGTIALRYRVAVDHLAFANGFPITTIEVAPGTQLFIPSWRILPANPPRNGVVVNLAERILFLFRDGRFKKFYPVSIGDEAAEKGRFQTPTGNYSIIEKIKNPTWYPPSWAKDRRPVGPGPNNPLGERWIGLSLTRTGIHGTNDPLNVGNSVTHGCMRTHPELLRELFDSVEVGFEARLEYETAKLGRDDQGEVYISNFPDIYKKRPSVAAAQKLLGARGLTPARTNFAEILELQLGTPVRVKGTESVYSEWTRQAGYSVDE